MKDMKHIAEAIGRSTPGRLDKEELLWRHDHYNYVNEGCRVDLSALLKMHCYTSARLQEICKAKYKVRY